MTARCHATSVPVPLITRTGVGQLIKQLGPIKTRCGRHINQLHIVWHEDQDDFSASFARGEIYVGSLCESVTLDALREVTALVNTIAATYTHNQE